MNLYVIFEFRMYRCLEGLLVSELGEAKCVTPALNFKSKYDQISHLFTFSKKKQVRHFTLFCRGRP